MTMLAQINSQLTPRAARRGLGAAATVVQPRHGWSVTLGNADAFIRQGAPVPIPLQAGRAITNLAVDTNGNITVSGVYQGAAPYTIPNEFYYSGDKFPVMSSTTTANPLPPCAGDEWLLNGQCIKGGNAGGGLVINGSGGGGGGGASGTQQGGGISVSKIALQHGDLVRWTIVAQGPTLPPTYQQLAPSTMQAMLDATKSKDSYTVQSVVYKNPGALVVEMVRNGPTVNVSSPVTETTDGIVVNTTFEDLGPPPSTSSKTVYYVAGGVAVVAVAGAAWWKYGRRGGKNRR